jgi:type II secretory pathway component PulK
MVQVEELYRVRGFDAATVAKLLPYVTALPVHTAINANTAPEALLDVVLLGFVPNDKIAQFVKVRGASPVKSIDAISLWKTPLATCDNGQNNCVPYAQWISAWDTQVK